MEGGGKTPRLWPLAEAAPEPEERSACHCTSGPDYDGPQEDCPQHGRPYSYWVMRADAMGMKVAQLEAQQVAYLTPDEHEAVQKAGELWGLLCRIVGDGETRSDDLTELVIPIHTIQRYVMAQAATRAYPGDYRPLGLVIKEESERP